MNIILTNTEDAGMPEEMAGFCRQLLERRILNTFDTAPEPGADVTILFSENDPLMESEELDETAYDIYFTVEKTEIPAGGKWQDGTVYLNLVF